MVAAGRGFLGVVEQLLNMGANIAIRSSNDWQALDWAQKYEQHDVVELLEAHMLVGTTVSASVSLSPSIQLFIHSFRLFL